MQGSNGKFLSTIQTRDAEYILGRVWKDDIALVDTRSPSSVILVTS